MDIRDLRPEEYEEAKKLLADKYPWGDVPPASSLIGKFEEGKLVGVVGIQPVWLLTTVAGDNIQTIRELLIAADQRLYRANYIGFVPKISEKFKDYIGKYFAEVIEGFEGMLFVRRR